MSMLDRVIGCLLVFVVLSAPVLAAVPTAFDDGPFVAPEGGSVEGGPNVLTNDNDSPDNDPFTAVLGTGPSNTSSFLLDPDGTFTYVHDGGETSSDSFTYTANDAEGASNVATVTLSITAVNDQPLLAAIGNRSVAQESQLTFTATATDADLPANTLTYSLDGGAPAGASINATSGVFTWTPTTSQGPSDFFITVRVTDNGTPNLNDFETITVTVSEEPNVAPLLGADR